MGTMADCRHIQADQLVEGDPTPGMVRRRAFHSDLLWAGVADTEPGMVSGWHHHGENESTIYVAEGSLRLEHGPGGRKTIEAGPGDFVHVPAGRIHREANPSGQRARLVLVRAGRGVPTVNVDGPEPG